MRSVKPQSPTPKPYTHPQLYTLVGEVSETRTPLPYLHLEPYTLNPQAPNPSNLNPLKLQNPKPLKLQNPKPNPGN